MQSGERPGYIVGEDRFMHWYRVLLAVTAVILLGIGSIMSVTAQSAPTDNFGFVRFIHTAIDVPPLDIYIGDANPTRLVSNLAYGEATDFMSLPTTV